MAPRKPNKSRRDKPNDSLANQVGGWLGGAAKVVGRAAAQNPLVAQNIRYGKAVAAGPTQLAKTAAIDLAAGAAGAGVGKAAVGVGRVVAKTGVPARMINKLTKQDIYLHGSPISGLKKIEPSIGANREYSSKRGAMGFFENPKASETDFGGMASAYARKSGGGFGVVRSNRTGSVYVVKGPKKSFTSDLENQMVYQNTNPIVAISKQPQKVVSEIKLENVGLGKDARSKAVADALRKAGYKLPKKK
jgi:hypothetical protein